MNRQQVPVTRSIRLRRRLAAAAGALAWAATGTAQVWSAPERLLIAPMIGGLDVCLIESPGDEAGAALKSDCRRPDGSAGARVRATLDEIGPAVSPSTRYELGYTLHVPLLRLFRPQAGDWRVDAELAARFARTIRDADRPVVLYLFATHFSVGAPLETELAQDPRNLAETPRGPLPLDSYHGLRVHPWSVAATDNGITQRRLEAIDAVVGEVCRLPAADRAKVRALTLLGEVHQLYPGFESGMGFASPYQVTDYSALSRARFAAFLQARFGTIDALNRHLGSSFNGFGAVEPPAKDIRSESLRHFWEHIDAFAHGVISVNGWVLPNPDGAPRWVRVFLDGRQLARLRADLGRQDVADAHPEYGTADVGWRFDLDFRDLAHGVHRIDVTVEEADGTLTLLGSRRFAHVDRAQSPAVQIEAPPPPGVRAATPGIAGSIDAPGELTAVFYNPLVPLWHEFRAQQVAGYLSWIRDRLRGTCLAGTPAYVHQIVPYFNPSWDSTRFAVGASLREVDGLDMGVSLYGEPAYGRSFFDWYREHSGRVRYGVTEFHPLRAMDADELQRVLDRHHAHGARFLSFFVDGVPRRPINGSTSIFVATTFNPDVRALGSDRLFHAVREVMAR